MYHEMHTRFDVSKSLLALYQIINKPLAGEIAEPCPDMNIKVTAFTVSEKSNNTKQLITAFNQRSGRIYKESEYLQVVLDNPHCINLSGVKV